MLSQKSIKFILIFFTLSLYTFIQLSANIVVLNGLTHENSCLPGEKYRESIQIQNAGTEPRTVKVYVRDYWYSYSGESRHDEPGTMNRSNATWIEYSPKLVTLAPKEKTLIDFEVSAPAVDSLNGTYWSVIMVEGVKQQDTTASAGVKINTAIRYAVQVITNIGKTGTRDLKFVGLELGEQDEESLLNVAVENAGERLLKPELSVELFNEAGESVGVFKAERRKALPGTSILLSLVLKGVEAGSYAAVLVANCDEDHIFGTNITLEI